MGSRKMGNPVQREAGETTSIITQSDITSYVTIGGNLISSYRKGNRQLENILQPNTEC